MSMEEAVYLSPADEIFHDAHRRAEDRLGVVTKEIAKLNASLGPLLDEQEKLRRLLKNLVKE